MLISLLIPMTIEAQQVIPVPVQQQLTSGKPFVLSSKTRVAYVDSQLASVATQLVGDLKQQTGLNLKQGSFKTSRGDIALLIAPDDESLPARKEVLGVSAKSKDGVDERYTLDISENGVWVKGASKEAVILACATLRQLLQVDSKVTIQAQTVKDAPLFAWRGLSLDVSRYFLEKDEVKKVIDMMALYKLNVLHLHLTDNQGWRFQVLGYPELTQVGGFVENNGRKGGFYTQEDYLELVNYAESRAITVVPELDLPGHTQAVFKAYPTYQNCASLPGEMNLAGQSTSAIDPDDDNAMKMVETAVNQLAALTPGRFIHIGGDETLGMSEEKYTRFIKLLQNYIKEKVHKEMVGWQEMARAQAGEGIIIQNWLAFSKKQMARARQAMGNAGTAKPSSETKTETASAAASAASAAVNAFIENYRKGQTDVPKALEQGAKILLSLQAYNYLDCPYEEESADAAQQAESSRLGMRSYTPQNLQDMYDWDPTTTLQTGTKDVAGVEAAIWCESVTSLSDLQFLVLPRLTGVAEHAWSQPAQAKWDTYKTRLSTQGSIWQAMGWNYFKSSLVEWK